MNSCVTYVMAGFAAMCIIVVMAGGLTMSGVSDAGPNVNLDMVTHGDTAWEQNANARVDSALDAAIADEATAEGLAALALFGFVGVGIVMWFLSITRPPSGGDEE